MEDWERDLDSFFEEREWLKQQHTDLDERLLSAATDFINAAKEGFEQACQGLARHGRKCLIVDNPLREIYPSVELQIDYDGQRELTYRLGCIRKAPMISHLTLIEAVGDSISYLRDRSFLETPIGAITPSQVRDNLIAIYKDTNRRPH